MLPSAWNMDSLGANYPPTLFVSMPRDLKTADRIKQVGGIHSPYSRAAPAHLQVQELGCWHATLLWLARQLKHTGGRV